MMVYLMYLLERVQVRLPIRDTSFRAGISLHRSNAFRCVGSGLPKILSEIRFDSHFGSSLELSATGEDGTGSDRKEERRSSLAKFYYVATFSIAKHSRKISTITILLLRMVQRFWFNLPSIVIHKKDCDQD